jgi:UDP-N-acetylglucosamine:LPS N-acetylglucosamine transferase
LALPFFDDQYYNAAALVEAGCALRIAKRPVEAQQVPGAGAKLPDEWGSLLVIRTRYCIYIYIFIFIY